MKCPSPIHRLVEIMAKLRSPKNGCPWDLQQDHMSLRSHAVEEVYELLDAIEAGDDHEMAEELGDLLLQVVFHSQLASERGAFDFNDVCSLIAHKLVRRHPHVFAQAKVRTVQGVWTQWDQIKHAEKQGTKHERSSALDGIPRHLPALLRAEKLAKKAGKARLWPSPPLPASRPARHALARGLFALAAYAQSRGWSAETLLRTETKRQEQLLRRRERRIQAAAAARSVRPKLRSTPHRQAGQSSR